jgi:hypothetical protein
MVVLTCNSSPGRLRQADDELLYGLGCIVRLCLKTKQNKKPNKIRYILDL